ncbi:MAG TPA: hypothetical protein VF069_14225 [Streptosporangiaceae bacterium]
MTEMKIDPHALEAFAKSSDRRREEYDRVRATADQTRVDKDSFGQIPGIAARVYSAYDEHVRGCEEGISSAAEAMGAIASGVRSVITNTDHANEAVQDSLRGIKIRGVD